MRKNKQKKSHHVNESWLLPYSDLLTLLLALFIVLFAMSKVDSQKYKELAQVFQGEFSGGEGILENSPSLQDLPAADNDEKKDQKKERTKGEQELEELEAIQKQIDAYIMEEGLDNTLQTKLQDEGLLITILNNISFDSGSARVTKEGKRIAKKVSDFLSTDPPREVVISGHTDDQPINYSGFSSNWELSVTRAVNFMQLLLNNDELDPTKFSAKGYGEHRPAVANTNEANREKNRRVEVLILPNYKIKPEKQSNE